MWVNKQYIWVFDLVYRCKYFLEFLLRSKEPIVDHAGNKNYRNVIRQRAVLSFEIFWFSLRMLNTQKTVVFWVWKANQWKWESMGIFKMCGVSTSSPSHLSFIIVASIVFGVCFFFTESLVMLHNFDVLRFQRSSIGEPIFNINM